MVVLIHLIGYTARGIIVGFRTLRTVKFIGKWGALTKTINFLVSTFENIFHFAILLASFIFLFSFIGLTLFANKIKLDEHSNIDFEHGSSSRVVNFDNIGFAFLSVYTLLIGDNWTSYFYQYTRFNNIAYFYFPCTIFIFNIMITNLFIAIILERFFSDDQKEAMAEEEKRDQAFNERQKKLSKIASNRGRYRKRVATLLTALKAYNAVLSLGSACKRKPIIKKGRMIGRSLYLFTPESLLRIWINKVIYNWAFSWVSYFFIALNSVIISFYTPIRDSNGRTIMIITILDIITTVFFCLEIISKIIVCGLICNGPKSLLRDPFNIVDFSVTVLDSFTTFFTPHSSVANKILKFFRTLRLFRLINMNKNFRLKVKAIIRGFPKIFQTMLIVSLFILIFSIIGVQLFKELLSYCSTENAPMEATIDTVYDCMNYGSEWVNRDIGFDNIFVGCMTLFELFSGKSWCNIITFIPDIYDYGYQPRRDVSTYNLWYPVIFMLFGFLCMRSLLMGVISNAYYFHNEDLQGLRELTGVQRRWVSLTKVIFKASPVKCYDSSFRFFKLYKFLIHPVFEYFITVTVGFNGIVLCLSLYKPPVALDTFCEVCYFIFITIYIFEAVLKLLFYCKDYFDDRWNVYDLLIAILMFVTTVLELTVDVEFINVMLYIIRALKICVLFHKVKLLSSIFQVFTLALPSILNSAMLLLIMMYIFAIIGICFFSDIKLQAYLNKDANFQTLVTAFLTVFRLSTYDGWNDLMHDAMRGISPSFHCISNPTYDDYVVNNEQAIGCGYTYASAYFILCILVIPFMFLNIFLAIVVASVMEIAQLTESVLSDERLNSFLEVWKKYDPRGEFYVEYFRVWNLLYEIPEPLGAAEKEMNNRYYSAMTLWMLQLRIYRHEENGLHYVAFYDVLEGLVKKCLYKPQTLDKIYNNLSKEMLIKGLQELWDQRTQLAMDSDLYMDRIEDLHYYYELKKSLERSTKYRPIRVNLPLLVWIILKISKQLKSRAKGLKKEAEKKKMIINESVNSPDSSSRMISIKDKDETKEPEATFDVYDNEPLTNFLRRTITNEVDKLTVANFGGQRFVHNVPKMSSKMTNKRKTNKGQKHNVPTEFQPNQSKFKGFYGSANSYPKDNSNMVKVSDLEVLD